MQDPIVQSSLFFKSKVKIQPFECNILCFNPSCDLKNENKTHNQCNTRSYGSIPLVFITK
jgi:hypothetical protein